MASKLVDLLNGSQYGRLNQLPGGNKNFSVRNQAGGEAANKTVIQQNAVDFFNNKYQTGFNTFKPTLSVGGFKKDEAGQTSDFTGYDGLDINTAFNTYVKQYNLHGKVGSLIQRYTATDMAKHFKTMNSSCSGIVLTYTPPTNTK